MNGRVQASGTTRAALLTIVVVVAVLRLAQEVLIPLALAILLTFLLAPMVALLTRWRINRAVAVVVWMLVGFALIGGMGDVVLNQFADLAHQLPSYQRQLRSNLTQFGGAVRGGVAETTHAFEQLTKEIDSVTPADPKPRGVSKVVVLAPPVTAGSALRDVS